MSVPSSTLTSCTKHGGRPEDNCAECLVSRMIGAMTLESWLLLLDSIDKIRKEKYGTVELDIRKGEVSLIRPSFSYQVNLYPDPNPENRA